MRLPVPLLLALRVAARRSRRALLGVLSIAITVSGLFVALVLDAFLTSGALVGAILGVFPGGRRAVAETLRAELT